MKEMDQHITTISTQESWYSRESTNALQFVPDGLWELSAYLDIWNPSALSLFETTKKYDTYIKNEPTDGEYRQEYVEHFVSNFKVQKRKDGSVEFLYFTDHVVQEERSLH